LKISVESCVSFMINAS